MICLLATDKIFLSNEKGSNTNLGQLIVPLNPAAEYSTLPVFTCVCIKIILSLQECDYLRAVALPRLQISTVVDTKTGKVH